MNTFHSIRFKTIQIRTPNPLKNKGLAYHDFPGYLTTLKNPFFKGLASRLPLIPFPSQQFVLGPPRACQTRVWREVQGV